jgi:hypothetical protein
MIAVELRLKGRNTYLASEESFHAVDIAMGMALAEDTANPGTSGLLMMRTLPDASVPQAALTSEGTPVTSGRNSNEPGLC